MIPAESLATRWVVLARLQAMKGETPMLVRLAILCLFSVLVYGPPASARIILTIDPDNYAEGTDLTNAIEGVTISFLSQAGLPSYDPVRSSAFAAECLSIFCAPDAGVAAFSTGVADFTGGTRTVGIEEYQRCFSSGSAHGCSSGFSVLEFAFAGPVDFVQLGFGWANDGPGFLAYDINGSLLASCVTAFGPGQERGPCDWFHDIRYPQSNGSFAAFQSDSRNISRVVAAGFPGTATVHQISYTVPEPATVAFLGIGLAGLGFARRRKP